MTGDFTKSETTCNSCGKDWNHAETFIIVHAKCVGYVERSSYIVKEAGFGEIDLGAFCEECAAKIERMSFGVKYDEFCHHTMESYLEEIDSADKLMVFPDTKDVQ